MRFFEQRMGLIVGLVLLVCGSLPWAQEPTRPGGGVRPPGDDWRARMGTGAGFRDETMASRGAPGGLGASPNFLTRSIELFDSDGNGVLSREEYEAGMREVFDRIDANGDGKIDREEMSRDLSSLWVMPPTRSRHLLRLYDQNNDGKITAEECLLPPKAMAELDLNKSGALESEDLMKLTLTRATLLQDPARRATALLAELDKDGDKRLSEEEFGTAKETFRKADRNADGQLDADELKLLPPLPVDHPQRRAEEMIARLDQDGDKMLSQNEFRLPGVRFEDTDSNKDGLVDFKELTAWFETARGRQFGPPSGIQMADRILDQFDRNGDGKLTKEELQGMPEAVWQRWDLNADGVVEATEIEKAFEGRRLEGRGMMMEGPDRVVGGDLLRGNPADFIKQHDRDGDGKLTAVEMGVDVAVFRRIDRDGDGKATAEELVGAQDVLRTHGREWRDNFREHIKPGKEAKP